MNTSKNPPATPSTQGSFPFVAAGTLTMKVCEGGRVINAVVGVGINGTGASEVLGVRVGAPESRGGVAEILRRPGGPALWAGVKLATSNAHPGPKESITGSLH